MKRLIIVLFILLVSCKGSNVETKTITYELNGYQLEVVTIDNCQYLYGNWANATVLTHKGNCNNVYHHLR